MRFCREVIEGRDKRLPTTVFVLVSHVRMPNALPGLNIMVDEHDTIYEDTTSIRLLTSVVSCRSVSILL